MKHYKRLLGVGLFVISLILALTAIVTSAQDSGTGSVRFVHVIPGASGIDIFTDGQLTASNLSYGQATGYINIPAGTHEIVVQTPGLPTILWQQEVTVEEAAPVTLIASSISPLEFQAFADDFSPLDLGEARVVIVHALAGMSGVDIVADGTTIAGDLQYGQGLTAIDVPANTYELAVNATGSSDVIIPAAFVGLASNTTQMFIVFGTPDQSDALVLSAPVSGGADSGSVRIAHAIAGAPAVDIYAGETLLVPNLSFGQTTVHLAIPAGDYTLEARVAGTTEPVLTADVTVEAGAATTVVALGTPEEASASVFADDFSGIGADTALASVINTIPGDSSVSVTLSDGTVLADDLASGEASDVVSIAPSAQVPSVTFTVGDQSATFELERQSFYGGVHYNIIALNATSFSPPTLIFAPTSLAQGIGSAPGAASATIVQAASPEAVLPATPVTEETQVAAEPTQPVVTEAPPAVATPESDLPTARIVLDPGVNLQLRQYPSSEALSLGLAPSGTILVVNGREGAPVDVLGVEITPEADSTEEPFVDPATLLADEDADLIPEETWLNITYSTPDGGQITAWVNALYLDVRAPDGEPQRLADLPLVPNNQPGEAINTAITPPPVPENRVTVVVINLATGVNLNIRRTPDPAGEVLARVPTGTEAEFVGLGQSGDWVFVRYLPAEGGTVTGWASTLYVKYQYNGRDITLDELQTRGLFAEADEETQRGEISAGVAAAAQPTRDPQRDAFVAAVTGVNPGTNLNLRRTPTDQAEVIQRIPGDSLLIVTGRTEDALWLQTSFEDQTGWIAAAFVTVTFNGEAVDITDIPVIDLTSTPTPTTTP